MNSALQLLNEFEASTADGFPLGKKGAEVLDQLERIGKLVDEAKSFYKAQLARSPHCVPGWTLRPGAIRRSLGDPQACWERAQAVITSDQFMSAVKVEIGKLQDIWSSSAGIPSAQAKEAFNKLMADQLVTFQNAPSLVKIK
jgi:hypothetical protein